MRVGQDACTRQEDIALFLSRLYGEPRTVEGVRERPEGPQGYSGSQIRYYDVDSRDAQGRGHQDTVVSKAAVRLERRILRLLDEQGCAAPPLYLADAESEGRAPAYMPYLDEQPANTFGGPANPLTLSVADGLAGHPRRQSRAGGGMAAAHRRRSAGAAVAARLA
jgi:hypothetical protein